MDTDSQALCDASRTLPSPKIAMKITITFKSKEEFIREYKKYDETSAREFYHQILTELKKTISEGNIDSFKKLGNSIDYINSVENQATLKNYYDNTDNPIKSTNLVVLACKHNKKDILKYLFGSGRKILNNLSVDIGRNPILPHDEDEAYHNAFYYTIRSNNVELLDTLISKWPGNYFAAHLEKLDEILSKAYEELKLKNILLSDEIEIFVESKLMNFRFYSNTSQQDQNVQDYFNNIKERIKLILQNISLLKIGYSNMDEVDEKFLFMAKFIARNIHILKQQLKSTYDSLPWEEMEFCLVIFISSHTRPQGINLLYRAILNKNKILNHLKNFAKKLENKRDIIEDINIDKLVDLPKLKREKVIVEIINSYPQFEELYNDYQQIRDIYSLRKINDCISLALLAEPLEREGQLIITRVLQFISEYLKNTLESPKLSSTTSELLLLSLPKNTREVIIDLRNALSHAYSLSKRTEIEEDTDISFFTAVQNDIEGIYNVIVDIYNNLKIKVISVLLKKITNSKSLDEIKEITEAFSYFEFDKLISENFKMVEHEKLEKIIKKLSDNITDKTNYEKELFNKINNIINCAGTEAESIRTDYITGLALLKGLSIRLTDNQIDHNVISGLKFYANQTLQNITSKIEPHSLKKIARLSMKISHSVRSRMQHSNLDEVNRLIIEILYIAEFGMNDIKWIEKLREKLNERGFFTSAHTQRKIYRLTQETYNNQLLIKLFELKIVLSNNSLDSQLIEKLPIYKSDRQLQAVVEMLVLDIMSILSSPNHYLENNLLFLDDNTPLLTGKCLRNHLVYDNALVDVLLSDPSIAVILNAKKLTEKNIMGSKKKIGKLVNDDPFKLREKYDQDLVHITNQERMFVALEEGNLESLKDCLKKGADINARNINSWTTLHFAAKGPSLEIIKFILDQNLCFNMKDIIGQTPLHIAAAHGRKNIVEFFVKEAHMYVDGLSNNGKTPLHLAAQNGHKDTLEVLLKNKADIFTQDVRGLSALHYAITNNHIDVAKILLEKHVNVDINETKDGSTPLHKAAESGHLELVNFLLRNKANVNARNDKDWTPLHAAALTGYLEVVNTLILKEADVNARVIDGYTPLHYAVKNGHEKVCNILLKHGANVNAVDKTYNNTPLHYAAKDGHEGIVKALLENEANAIIATVEGITPLRLAVQSGHLEIVTALLKHSVDIHTKDKNNATLLHYAAESGHKEVAELLIKNGAKVNAKANNNLTPLHVVALKDHKDVADLLIKNEAEVNTQDINGDTPLHAAARNGSKDVIDLLIKNRAEVDAKTHDGITPLHAAALNGHANVIISLIKNKAEANARDNHGLTPLHSAVLGGYNDIVNILIKNEAQVDAKDTANNTPLHLAVEAGRKEIVKILVANGANVNVKSDNLTPLLSAIKYNRKEIIEIMIVHGANVNAEDGKPLLLAVLAGYRDIVEILLKNKAHINIKGPNGVTLLHLAAEKGHKKIVNALVTRGAEVDAMAINDTTPLYLAAQEGHEEVVEILIANKANVNVVNVEGTPLHIAAIRGHDNIVKVLLLNGAKINIKDNENRMPLELAVAHGHLHVVKMFLRYKKVDMDAKCDDEWTILHIASQGSNLQMVKYLVDKGSDINAKNASGSKPVHIAAGEGYEDIVKFFLSNGLSINDLDTANQTLLHYATMKNHLEVIKYLITQGADIDAKDANGLTPMHIAANFGYKDVIEVLLKNGAVYNAVDKFDRKPLEMANDKNIINLLTSTKELFEAVKRNSSSEVENCIKTGAIANAKNTSGIPLHYAAWKGYDGIVNILLQNKTDPNTLDNKGFTPLHYATKFSHLKVVKVLLSNGAVYNAVSSSGKTPSDLTVDKSITSLFELVSKSFKNIKNGNSHVVNDLNNIKDIDTVKAIMGARNRENKTLVVVAVHSNFSKIEELKQISQGDISSQINIALVLLEQNNLQKALSIFKSAFEKRKEILGPDNPGTLNIQTYIAEVSYVKGAYQEALDTLEEIFQKQKEMLGLDNKDTLNVRSKIAIVLHRQGKDEEAFNICKITYQRQKEILGPNHSDTIDTQFHLALILHSQGKYEEALDITKAVLERRKRTLCANHPATLCAENNIAMILSDQGKCEEALKIYKEVFEKRKMLFGMNHHHTLRSLHHIGEVFWKQTKYDEALKTYQDVLNIQKKILEANHPDILRTRYNMANILFDEGKWIGALRIYREDLDEIKAIFEPSHPFILAILNRIKMVTLMFNIEGTEASEILKHLQKDINIAANNGNIQTVKRLLRNGADANDKDIDGRTALHYAVDNGQIDVVNILLKNGANVTQVTNEGNTPLHTATFKDYKEIVEVLLQCVSPNKLNDFINAKTTVSGATSLHVAARNGSLEVVKSLLKHGAIYNIENKEGKIPCDLSINQNVINLLKLVGELFEDAENGNIGIISKLQVVKSDEFVAVTNARNNQDNTLLQVTMINKHKNIARKLIEMLKTAS